MLWYLQWLNLVCCLFSHWKGTTVASRAARSTLALMHLIVVVDSIRIISVLQPLWGRLLLLCPFIAGWVSLMLTHSWMYTVPHAIFIKKTKQKLIHLTIIGLFFPQGTSECVIPIFITPRNIGHVCLFSDLRTLNRVLIMKQYPLPVIANTLKKWKRYVFCKMIICCNATHLI